MEALTDHGRVSVAEGQAGVGESRREAAEATVVHRGQQAVHVCVGALQPRTLADGVAAQNMDGLLQTVFHFTLLRE